MVIVEHLNLDPVDDGYRWHRYARSMQKKAAHPALRRLAASTAPRTVGAPTSGCDRISLQRAPLKRKITAQWAGYLGMSIQVEVEDALMFSRPNRL